MLTIASSKHEGGGGGFEVLKTVMQTRDAVKSLYNFQEFSQPPKCLDEAI